MSKNSKILLLGYGNPGRQDDGLGPVFIQRIESYLENISSVLSKKNIIIDTDSDYQLNLEIAHDLKDYKQVIFVDASINIKEPFSFYKINSNDNLVFHTHSVTAEAIIHMANNLYKYYPEPHVLAIRGYNFDGFGEVLSSQAQNNLDQAFDFLIQYLSEC